MFLRYLSSLIFILIIVLFFVTYNNYKNLYKYRDFSYSPQVKRALIFESLLDTRSDIYRIFDFVFYNPDSDDIKKVFLNIQEGDLEKARQKWENKTLLGDTSEINYFSSSINLNYHDKKFQKSGFRFRGKSDWHLRLEKPSLRIKLKNYQTYNMMKHINLTFPEGRGILENYYPNFLSKKIGLIGHYGEFVELYINNISYGVYHLHSREDESLIRLNKRMPSAIISGQNLKIEKWDINDFDKVNFTSINRNHDIFERMIDEIYKPKNYREDWNKLWNIVNFENSAKYVALKTILGAIHDDYWHNHEFFYDRTIGKIEPIINDAQSLGTYLYPRGKNRISLNTFLDHEKPDYKIPINQKTNPFFNGIISDTYFYHKKNQIIDDLINNELSYENQKKLLSKIYSQIDNAVHRDIEKRYLVERVNGWQIAKSSNYQYDIYKKNIFDFIEQRNLFLKNQLKQNYFKYSFIKLKEYQDQLFLKIDYKGEMPVELNKKNIGKIYIYNVRKNKFTEYKKENLLIHTGLSIVKNNHKFTNEKLGNDIFHDHHYETSYQTYLIRLNENINLKKLEKYFNTLKNTIIKKEILSKQLSLNDIKFDKTTTHIWSEETNENDDVIFDDQVYEIKEDIIITKNQKLIINDGATLLLWPDVSIFSEGKVLMNGKDKGIKIKNKFENKPWGNISVFGNPSSGSIFRNTIITGGSTKDINNILFSGMINFFWNENILIDGLKISNNSLGDDTLHFTKSSGKIYNLEIFDCLSDCIDMDYSSYLIENLNCYNSFNDGLDLMESKVKGINLNFSKNLDKSISVGEASELIVNNLNIINSNVGVASKDDSVVNLTNLKIEDTNLGLDSYRKNSKYSSSGKINIKNFKFLKNRLDLRYTNKSQILFDYKKLNYIQN